MKKLIATGAGIFSLVFAGCGGGSHHTTTTTTTTPSPPVHNATLQQQCPPGHSFMSCSLSGQPARTFQLHLKTLSAPPKGAFKVPSGELFPDVSNWQGHVDWPVVGGWQKSHGWSPGGVFKLGEAGSRDTTAADNARQLATLHYWKSGYWFVRAINCTVEANDIISAAHDYGVTLVAEDLEVPEANGYGQCLTPKLKAAGLKVVEYTSPGANPGGADTSQSLWQAEYGSSLHPIWHPVVAWQCTDGHFGCATFVPGIGFGDVSVDYGMSRLAGGRSPAPPDPFAVLLKVPFKFGNHIAREYYTAKTWHDHGCSVPARRAICRTSYANLRLLIGRLWFVAHDRADRHGQWHPLKRADWSNYKGARFHIMWAETQERRK